MWYYFYIYPYNYFNFCTIFNTQQARTEIPTTSKENKYLLALNTVYSLKAI